MRRLLLDLLSTRQPVTQATVDTLSAEDWQAMLDMAHEHRLLQMMHWRLGHERAALVVPSHVRDTMRAATQKGTIRALKIQAELLRVVRLLDSLGIPCMALKGAYLAFEVYPQPSMRPLRDLDILVPPEQALAADAALRAAGFTVPEGADGDPAVCLVERKHLPPLISPASGICIELHARLTRPDYGRTEGLQLADMWDRRVLRHVGDQAIACLSPTDLLLHLIYHAAYDHRLDNGPLTLTDLDYLIRHAEIDWPLFWNLAREGDWVRGCLLLLAMTQRFFEGLSVSYDGISADEIAVAETLAETGAALILRHKDEPYVYIAASLVGRSRPRQLLILARHFLPSRRKMAIANPEMHSVTGTLRAYARKMHRMFAKRLPNLLRDALGQSMRHEVKRALELERWLTRTP